MSTIVRVDFPPKHKLYRDLLHQISSTLFRFVFSSFHKLKVFISMSTSCFTTITLSSLFLFGNKPTAASTKIDLVEHLRWSTYDYQYKNYHPSGFEESMYAGTKKFITTEDSLENNRLSLFSGKHFVNHSYYWEYDDEKWSDVVEFPEKNLREARSSVLVGNVIYGSSMGGGGIARTVDNFERVDWKWNDTDYSEPCRKINFPLLLSLSLSPRTHILIFHIKRQF